MGVGIAGIGVGLGGGDVLVGPSFAALIVGSGVCDAGGGEGDEHAEEHSSTKLHKADKNVPDCLLLWIIRNPPGFRPLSNVVLAYPIPNCLHLTVIPLHRERQSQITCECRLF